MKCIKVITDKDFNLLQRKFDNPRIRYGARGIVINHEGKIAIINKTLKNEYKLVGGGIEDNENPVHAFKRETLEETGTIIEINDFLGIIREEKSLDNFIQVSYIYIANVVEDTKKLNFTLKEKKEGTKLLWLDFNMAYKLISESESKLKPSNYDGKLSVYHTKFIVRRDAFILEYYKENYKN